MLGFPSSTPFILARLFMTSSSSGRSWPPVVGLVVFLLVVAGCGATGDLQPNQVSNDPAGSMSVGVTLDDAATAPATQAATPASPAQTPGLPASTAAYDGIPVGFTAEGYPYLGDPEAPITIVEFSDYLCPFCARHFGQTLPTLMEEHVARGKVRYVFRDFPIAALHPTAPQGAAAARCVGEQGADLYWKMHDLLFQNQAQWNSLADPAEFLAQSVAQAGADSQAYAECMASGRTATEVDQAVAAAREFGFNATPTFQFMTGQSAEPYVLVGAQPAEIFAQWIGAMAAGGPPPQEPTPEPAELPFWASPEGLMPDPERPGFTMGGDPYKGNPDASMAVVEFSDFQCPSCRTHALETQPGLDERFVDSGEVLWVFKHLPLRMHPQAVIAAVAAECAAEQGKFWEMHDRLFDTVEQWAVEQPEPILLATGGELGLNRRAFAECLDSRQALERVLADLYDAQDVTAETPTFVALYGGAGRVIRGSKPVDEFIATLEGLLEQARAVE
jgi:protein-disulfide isomerase